MNILLIHPPQSKPGEPPAGIPLLAGTLRNHGCQCTVCDLNIEGLDYLLSIDPTQKDTWSKRAFKNRYRQIDNLQSPATYLTPDKYKRAVADLNRVIENAGKAFGLTLSLANYQDPKLSPQVSADLLNSAENYKDNIYYPFFSKRLTTLIEENQPVYIGLSINYLSQALISFAIAGFLRKTFPGVPLITGGGLVTTWLQNPGWCNPFDNLFTHMISGPGEYQLLELLGIKREKTRNCPDYTDLVTNQYLAPGLTLPYATSTGCFWRKCSFCPETSEKNPYKPVEAKTVIKEIHDLIDRHKPSMVHFLDNAVSPAVLKTIVENPLQVPWYGFVRFTSQLADVDFCKKLHNSGCVMLKLGLESGSQEVLDRMGKGIRLDLVAKSLKAMHAAGIMTYVYLLFGTPAETSKEAYHTVQFVREHHREITFLNLAIFNLPACSPQVHELEVKKFYEGDLSIYTDFQHPHGWDRKEIRRFLESSFKRDTLINRIMLNDPPLFTSNHAPFFSEYLKVSRKE